MTLLLAWLMSKHVKAYQSTLNDKTKFTLNVLVKNYNLDLCLPTLIKKPQTANNNGNNMSHGSLPGAHVSHPDL